ncbi:MAG: HEAT repeat domain-containing protein [Planctomycetota bacterium]|jgi:HEAT repeat protein
MRLRSLAVLALLATLAAGSQAGEADAARDMIPKLKEDALDGLTDERVAAIVKLGRITDEKRLTDFQVPQFLLGVVDDDGNNPVVRSAAADALAKIFRFVPDASQGILKPLLARLQDSRNESFTVRRKIAEVMAVFLDPEAIGHRTTFQALMRIARDKGERPLLVAEVLRTLGRTNYGGATKVVIESLNSPDKQIQKAALEALEMLLANIKLSKPNEVFNQLVTIINDEKVPEEIRIKAMKTLVSTIRAGVPVNQVAGPLVQVLNKACEKKEPKMAREVVRALHRVPSRASLAALRTAYTTFLNTPAAEGFPEVREAVAKTLGEYLYPLAKKGDINTGQEVAKLLLEISRTGSDKPAQAAVKALRHMENPRYDRREVVADLIDAMARDPMVKKQAYRSLVLITGVDLGEEVDAWKAWYKDNKAKLQARG